MKRDPMTVALAVLLLVSAAATAGMCYWHLQSVRQLQFAQEHVANINRNKALVQSLASESVEYGRRNPEILRLLQGLGIRSRGDTNSPAPEARP